MKKVVLAVGIIVVLTMIAIVLIQPSRFAVIRTTVVAAAPDDAFARLSSLHRWPKWSAWGKDRVPGSDALAGPESGVGSSWTWQPQHGEVRKGLEITQVSPPGRLVLKIVGDSPAQPELIFDLKPEGTGTRVTATFAGDLKLFGKAASLVKSPEAVAGPSLERELSLFAAWVASP